MLGGIMEGCKVRNYDLQWFFGLILLSAWTLFTFFGILSYSISSLLVWAIFFFNRSWLSFQFRERGLAYRLRPIKFADIQNMEWSHLSAKEKIRVTYKSNKKAIEVIIPSEFKTKVDDYIRDYYPRT
jgi:hypothetical protein